MFIKSTVNYTANLKKPKHQHHEVIARSWSVIVSFSCVTLFVFVVCILPSFLEYCQNTPEYSEYVCSNALSLVCLCFGRLCRSTAVWSATRPPCCPLSRHCRTKLSIWSTTWAPRRASNWTCSPPWGTPGASWRSHKVWETTTWLLLTFFF